MPDEAPTVRLVHAEPFADGKGRERIVAILDDGDIAIAVRPIGEAQAQAEMSFNLGEALQVAEACLGGNSHALTIPGLTRILCASIIALSRAAYQAGALVERGASVAEGKIGSGDDDDNE